MLAQIMNQQGARLDFVLLFDSMTLIVTRLFNWPPNIPFRFARNNV